MSSIKLASDDSYAPSRLPPPRTPPAVTSAGPLDWCLLYSGRDLKRVCPEDFDAFEQYLVHLGFRAELPVVVARLTFDGEYSVVRYRDYIFRVVTTEVKPLPVRAFDFFSTVEVEKSGARQAGRIEEIDYHFKFEDFIYYLSFEGKPNKRRYVAADFLSPRPHAH